MVLKSEPERLIVPLLVEKLTEEVEPDSEYTTETDEIEVTAPPCWLALSFISEIESGLPPQQDVSTGDILS